MFSPLRLVATSDTLSRCHLGMKEFQRPECSKIDSQSSCFPCYDSKRQSDMTNRKGGYFLFILSHWKPRWRPAFTKHRGEDPCRFAPVFFAVPSTKCQSSQNSGRYLVCTLFWVKYTYFFGLVFTASHRVYFSSLLDLWKENDNGWTESGRVSPFRMT